jgi:hypothetical protein
MKSYVQYIARDVRWYIIVKSYFSYDGGGPPVGVYGKVAARNEDGVAHVPFIYLKCTYITRYKVINTKLMGFGCPAHQRGVASVGFCHWNHEKLYLYRTLT